MNYKADQIDALKKFKESYNNLLLHWDRGGSSLNDLNAIRHYPFHKSLDELDVNGWVDAMVYELRPEKQADEPCLTTEEVHNLMKILREKRDDIGCVSVHTVDELYNSLKCLAYVKSIKDFHSFLDGCMPDLPNDTPAEQKAYDEAWEKFYETQFTIGFGGKMVTIENEATIYNGIMDTLKELIDNCL